MDDTLKMIIGSIVGLLFTGGIGFLLKRSLSQASKAIEKSTKVENTIETSHFVTKEVFDIRIAQLFDVDVASKKCSDDLIQLKEQFRLLENLSKSLTSIEALRSEFLEKFQRKPDFIRDIQLINSQIETIHKKIDHLDDKLDRIRNRKNEEFRDE